ncbi:MAG TPA: ABC transporter ATP-binding protein [Aquifex aeolicus]|uniref:ABC transporter ATP-binding protein n=1 Tax=Aquifex aeolicus TaxID=63363 RepID=A0A9D0YP77_AQUAO|nr:ABC transporter ATP-binding protein [Aquificales bacterium]HIP98131.1 ABC transporter ATP-binding protein [Aquifex aeolicus]HIQ26011.1 ABC transporter ATP-binding protein [Aquifex aeolicus]
MVLLEVKNLTVFYPNSLSPALDRVSFQLKKGEIFCIVGESGSGKSTLLRAIAGLLQPGCKVEGEVTFKGEKISSQRGLEKFLGKEVGFIFQEPSAYLDPLFKVGNQIEETCLSHFPNRNCREKTLNALRYCGFSNTVEVYEKYPHQLSGGQKQRVSIADAVVNNPSLLLADEPTSSLDVSTQKAVLELFLKLKRDGKAVLMVTHDFGVVWEIADRVLVIKEGKKVEEGSVFEIYGNPRHPYTRKLVEIFKKLSLF